VIETNGTITVAEAARRLGKSTEQVRRYLREGKLKGQRVGSQWFVDEEAIDRVARPPEPLIPAELVKRIDDLRESIFKRNGLEFDVVGIVRESREGH
jgi:excisionase family DNA binding protein